MSSHVLRAHASWLDRASDSLRGETGQAAISQQTLGQVEQAMAEPSESRAPGDAQPVLQRVSGRRRQTGRLHPAPHRDHGGGRPRRRASPRLSPTSRAVQKIDSGWRSNLNVEQVNALAKNIADLSHTIANVAGRGPCPPASFSISATPSSPFSPSSPARRSPGAKAASLSSRSTARPWCKASAPRR